MKKTPFTKLHQLERYISQLQKLVKTGRFIALSAKKQKKLVARIKRLQGQLSFYGHSKRVKHAFASAAIVLGLAFGNTASAQNFNFKPVQVNPFGISPTGGYFTFPTFGDLDGDGDYDMIAGEYSGTGFVLRYYENTGTALAPSFATSQNNPFGLSPNGYSFSAPQLVDLDGDGDLDILSAENYSITYYQNTGTNTAPSFAAPVNNAFGITANGNTTVALEYSG